MTEGLSGVAGPFWGWSLPRFPPIPCTRWRRHSAVRRYPGQSRRLSATTRRARRPGVPSLVPPRGVGADAYIGPLLRTTCGASVGRGNYTPPFLDAPPCSAPRRGRAPSRPVTLPFTPISVGSRMPFGPRRGGPMCPPVDGSCEEPCPGRHIGRPLQNLYLPPQTGRGRSPAPTGLSWCQAAGRQSRTPAPAKAAQPDRSARDPRPAIPRRAHSQLSILNFPPKPSACPGSGPGQALSHVLSLEMGSRKMRRRMALPSKGTRG